MIVIRICFYIVAMETQVSKSAPTGEYLTTGSFMIRGLSMGVFFRCLWFIYLSSFLYLTPSVSLSLTPSSPSLLLSPSPSLLSLTPSLSPPIPLGKKNFLPPCQLVLGFGFLFRVSPAYTIHLHVRVSISLCPLSVRLMTLVLPVTSMRGKSEE